MSNRKHPRRLRCNVEGDFYATGDNTSDGEANNRWMGDCLACGGPESVAPDLLAELNESNITTYFVKQPSTLDEIDRACRALNHCCVDALRYGGHDPTIIGLLGNNPAHCDYVTDENGELVYCLDGNGELLPWAQQIVNSICYGQPRPPTPGNEQR
jgi:hypothetical protein